jgi:hypothetical protein
MTVKLLIDIPEMNWAYNQLLDPAIKYTLGSAKDCSISVPLASILPQHAAISRSGDGWIVENVSPDGQTLVNGAAIAKHKLANKDQLKLGTCSITFLSTEESARGAEWNHTQRVAEKRQADLQQVMSQAQAGTMQPDQLGGVLTGRAGASAVEMQLGQIGKSVSSPTPVPGPNRNTGALSPSDLIWSAQELSSILSAVLSQKAPREETYRLMLEKLRAAINADNGFVMMPEQMNTKWVIRAWVGDNSSWTEYEAAHPLPLTVTNRAYQTMSVVSNALSDALGGQEPINSVSMRALNVRGYIAVPLLDGKIRRGVLYFDTRQKDKRFLPRDVKLMELAGACLVEIENQPA